MVHIDETYFRTKPKFHKGRRLEGQWVFGGVDTSKQPHIGFMEIVETRNQETLLPIIEKYIADGSTIHSDQWKAYDILDSHPCYQHRTVNHSLNYVDPNDGVHTQAIEGYWSKIKTQWKAMRGSKSECGLGSYLDDRIWRDRFGTSPQDAFQNLLYQMSDFSKQN